MRRRLRNWALLLSLALLSGCGACVDEVDDAGSEGSRSSSATQSANQPPPPPVVAETAGEPVLSLTGDALEAPLVAPTPSLSRTLAPRDLTAATDESEPNDDQETASPLDADFAAKGRLEGRDKDVFTFVAEGEPQLWSIEARGDNIERVSYLGSRLRSAVGVVSPDDPALHTITNLYLLPGQHWIEVRSRSGSAAYTVRAVPLGPPEPGMELEPNDSDEQAHLLRFGETRSGHLFETRDRDHYRFHLTAEEQVELRWTPPPGVVVKAFIRIEGRSWPLIIDVPDPDGAYRYRAVLPIGLHVIELRAERGRSDQPYAIRLDRLNPYLPAVDREPNDQPREAAPFPATMRLEGTTRGNADPDWYRLPTFETATTISVEPGGSTLEDFSKRDGLVLHDGAGKRLQPGLTFDEESGLFSGELLAGQEVLVRVRGFGAYEYRFEIAGLEALEPGEPRVAMALPQGPHQIAAFWHEAQRLSLRLGLRNTGQEETTLTLDVAASDRRWRPALERNTLTLAGGEQAEIRTTVDVEADAWSTQPVHLTVRATDETGAVQTAAAQLEAVCGQPPIDPQPLQPLPEELLGGLNFAWGALGGQVEGDGKVALLIDGLTPNDGIWRVNVPATATVELAGDRPIPITGVLLNPKGQASERDSAREFSVAVSVDGSSFQEVLTASLGREPYEQAFPFDQPVEARFVRLSLLSSHNPTGRQVSLGEFKVIARPGEPLVPGAPLDLGAPEVGGNVLWADPIIPRPEQILTSTAEKPKTRVSNLQPFRWVVGVHHGRAARVTALEWVQPSAAGVYTKLMGQVQVAVSLESPTGPWDPVGTWELDPEPGSVSRLSLPEGTWVRYLRFSHTEATKNGEWFHVSESLRIFEQPQTSDYRSILGEWGHYARPAVYEWQARESTKLQAAVEADDETRAKARTLELDELIVDRVELDRDVDWYRIRVPRDHNRLRLDLRGQPDLRVVARLYDEDDRAVPLEEVRPDESEPPVLEALVTTGDYYLKLEEPPRSVAFVWDNSGSVGPYRPTIYQALTDFATDIRAGAEFANLMPFQGRGSKFLLEEWTDDSYLLQRAVNDYDRGDGSSDAPSSVRQATKGLAGRTGAKAMILLTDAEFGGYVSKPEVWALLNEVRPRIFALELHRGRGAANQQDIMQGWAAVNGGHYTFFSTNADLEVAFERASCLLRRPAGYTLTASTRFEEPPGPGLLSVELEEGATPTNAIELILDASGSMLQRLGSKRRIEIARDVLLELVNETLPEGTPLALRIFGHREADSCRTDLEVPLAPLDRSKVSSAIRSTQAKNLAKTPIADSLRLVAEDLKSADGQRLVILITDGEETCEGDPAEAVAELREAGIDVRLNIVGFAIEDEVLKADFSRWADAGGGRYFDAADEAALNSSVKTALMPKFQVLDAGGDVVGEGTVGESPIELPVGVYDVRVLTSPPLVLDGVEIESESETRLTASPEG